MHLDRIANWLQFLGNIGIIGGLALVGIQINQNTEIVRLQTLGDDSSRATQVEYVVVG